jgi:hypothetical protein
VEVLKLSFTVADVERERARVIGESLECLVDAWDLEDDKRFKEKLRFLHDEVFKSGEL